jgi:hypothetical protein
MLFASAGVINYNCKRDATIWRVNLILTYTIVMCL